MGDGKPSAGALRWSRQLSFARADAALSAYTTALDWLRRYPAYEVEQRLLDMIAAKRAAIIDQDKHAGRAGGRQRRARQ